MVDERIEVGDRVITTQVPGVFLVVARNGSYLTIETADGLSMTVSDAAVRRLEAESPAPDDAGTEPES
jgi:preprotein translocase subunit YajC